MILILLLIAKKTRPQFRLKGVMFDSPTTCQAKTKSCRIPHAAVRAEWVEMVFCGSDWILFTVNLSKLYLIAATGEVVGAERLDPWRSARYFSCQRVLLNCQRSFKWSFGDIALLVEPKDRPAYLRALLIQRARSLYVSHQSLSHSQWQ